MAFFAKIHITDLQQMVANLREDSKEDITAAIWPGLKQTEKIVTPSAGDIIVLNCASHSRVLVKWLFGCLRVCGIFCQ